MGRGSRAAALSVAAALASCRAIPTPPPGQDHAAASTRTEYVDRVERDTVYVKDSIYVRQRGDTVFVDRWRYAYKERVRVDTVATSTVDTIRITQRICTERTTTRWERLRLAAFPWLLIFCAVCVVVFGRVLSLWRH